ncbi:MAG: multicopper oxidase domain-containing protein, partial [Bacteroidota bacterium]
HPYHIHVNPFQVTQFEGKTVNPPIWKDVIMVQSPATPTTKTLIRSRYTRYWGDFVLHCHILHHEDEGMMQRIRIMQPPLKKKAPEKK